IGKTLACICFLVLVLLYVVFFFFSSRRRHTRSYGDWSSDVCSSDLNERPLRRGFSFAGARTRASLPRPRIVSGDGPLRGLLPLRSEERRVGKECRSRWWP